MFSVEAQPTDKLNVGLTGFYSRMEANNFGRATMGGINSMLRGLGDAAAAVPGTTSSGGKQVFAQIRNPVIVDETTIYGDHLKVLKSADIVFPRRHDAAVPGQLRRLLPQRRAFQQRLPGPGRDAGAQRQAEDQGPAEHHPRHRPHRVGRGPDLRPLRHRRVLHAERRRRPRRTSTTSAPAIPARRRSTPTAPATSWTRAGWREHVQHRRQRAQPGAGR